MDTYKVILYVEKENSDAAGVAQWVGEAMSSSDVQDSNRKYKVYSVEVESV